MESVEQWEFESLERFYDARRERRYSPEALYGVQWRMAPYRHTWQVSYIRDTGEVYARANGGDGPVWLLGSFPPDERREWREVWYRSLDTYLEGWADYCGAPDGLKWLWRKLRDRTEIASEEGVL